MRLRSWLCQLASVHFLYPRFHLQGLVSTNEQCFSVLFRGANVALLLYAHFVT